MFSLKNLFAKKPSTLQAASQISVPHLTPVEPLEIGSDRNGEFFLAVYAASDNKRYVLTLAKGAEINSARLSAIGEDAHIQITSAELADLAKKLRHLSSQKPECSNAVAQQCLNAFESLQS